jgi:peptidoglycan/LPS O-acetylase OafA/YrhL
MSPRFSLYLDAVRFCAALVVLVSHFAYPRFSHGDLLWVRELNLGSDAVAIFFVLSGLVIAHATATKDKTLGAYGFNRVTRLLSVALPAVIVTVLIDRFGAALAPAQYDGWWWNDAPALETLARALTFTNELWFESFRVGTNGPYWSLAYEAWFYILFGAAIYLRGRARIAAIALAALIMGPKMLALLPVWLCGVWCYKHIRDPKWMRRSRAWLLALAPPLLYVLALAIKLPTILIGLSAMLFGVDFVGISLAFSDEFIWNFLIGVGVAAHFIGMRALLGEQGARGGQSIRWLSGATFSIYLVHYPLLQFFDSILPDDLNKYAAQALVFFPTLALCILFAQAFERPLPLWRKLARQLIAARPAPAPLPHQPTTNI